MTGTKACNPDCRVVADLLARLGDRWSALIIYRLGQGRLRFNELKREIGISQRMLSLTLRELEREGLILRHHFPTIPPRVEYELSPLGQTLRAPIRALADWAHSNSQAMERARAVYDSMESGQVAAE